jgi:hypothetical protein
MATPDGGLAAGAYGPSEVKTTVAGGTPVTIVEETEYPFRDTISLVVTPERATAFPLVLRIPAWADGASVTVNGAAQPGVSAGSWHRLARTWQAGDRVVLQAPMKVRASRWYNESIALERGPLVFSLRIGTDWRELKAGMKNSARPPAKDWELHPTTPWNYALAIDPARLDSAVTVRERPVGPTPFSLEGAPIELTVPGRRLAAWEMVDGSAAAPPQSPVRTDAQVETLTLIPYGSAKLRITAFPLAALP